MSVNPAQAMYIMRSRHLTLLLNTSLFGQFVCKYICFREPFPVQLNLGFSGKHQAAIQLMRVDYSCTHPCL